MDLVLVSHNHYDHLDDASVAALHRQPGGAPCFVVPLGLKPWFAARGSHHVVELDWGDSHHRQVPGYADLEVLTTNWSAFQASPAFQVIGNGKWLVFPCTAFVNLWPEDIFPSYALQLAVMPASNAPLAQRAASAALYRPTSVTPGPFAAHQKQNSPHCEIRSNWAPPPTRSG